MQQAPECEAAGGIRRWEREAQLERKSDVAAATWLSGTVDAAAPL